MSITKQQGWINYYRKHFLRLMFLLYIVLFLFVEPLFPVSDGFIIIMKTIGILFIFIGIMGRVVASMTMSFHKNKKVVSTEIYSIIRHPLYFFSFFLVVGVSFFIARVDIVIFAIFAYILCFYPMMINEENYLGQAFAEEYREYKKKTPRIIPNISNWNARDTIEINFNLVMKTLIDASLALLVIPLIEIVQYINNTIN